MYAQEDIGKNEKKVGPDQNSDETSKLALVLDFNFLAGHLEVANFFHSSVIQYTLGQI